MTHVVGAVDGAAVRRRWDAACAAAEAEVRKAREVATARDEAWVANWFSNEIGQLATLQAMVDGKRLRPGSTASGLFRDFPPDLGAEPYQAVMAALEEVDRLYDAGLDAGGWDWSQGFPPGWPTSLKDRLRSYLPVHRA